MNKTAIYIGLGVAGVALSGYLATPRGIRNKNPMNVRYNAANNWDGQSGKDSANFAQFESVHYGIRAGAKLLRNYQSMHGLNTIREILSRYAPTEENDTESYIQSVAQKMKVTPDSYLALSSDFVLIPLVQAIIKHENGVNPYTYEAVLKAVRAAI
jgi:hypothetical protein